MAADHGEKYFAINDTTSASVDFQGGGRNPRVINGVEVDYVFAEEPTDDYIFVTIVDVNGGTWHVRYAIDTVEFEEGG